MVFETIELNRHLRGYDSLTVSILTPYHGTELRKLAVERGYLAPDVISTHTTSSSILNMPQLTSKEIDGLMRTFTSYVRFPKEEWPRIRMAEQDTEEGNKIFEEYRSKFIEQFFQGTQVESSKDWNDVTEYAVSPESDGTRVESPWGYNCGSEQKKYVTPPRNIVS